MKYSFSRATIKLNVRAGNRHLTGLPVTLTLDPIAKAILEKRKNRALYSKPADRVFRIPSNDGCNKLLQKWMADASIEKYIT